MFIVDRIKGWLVWQVRHHVEEVTLPLLAVLPRLDELSGQIEDVRRATVEVQRVVTDDLDASNEAAAMLGRSLDDLRAAVDQLRDDIASRTTGSGTSA